MKSAFSALVAVALSVTQVFGKEVGIPSDVEIAEILARRIDRDQAGVGVVVAVVENGTARFVAHGQYGRHDARRVDERTLFEAGSITKVFTNLMLAGLVIEGRIDLDAPITQYLPPGAAIPEFDGKAITVFDLSTHMSGLSSLPNELLTGGSDNPYSGYGGESLLEWLAGYRLNQPIGGAFEYSNVGAALLGMAMTHVDGRSYAQLLEETVLEPLGMDQTRLALTGVPRPDMADGHDMIGDAVSYWDFDSFAPAGGLITSAGDLAKFLAAASGAVETPLRPAFDLLLERTRPTGHGTKRVGLGPFVSKLARREIAWHNGATGGFNSFLGIDTASGTGVAVLANMISATGIEDIGAHLLDAKHKLRPQPRPRAVVEMDPAVLPIYAGAYQMGPDAIMTVSVEDGRLFIQLSGQQRFRVYPESSTMFFLREVDAQVSFVVEDGRAVSLTLHQNGGRSRGKRIE